MEYQGSNVRDFLHTNGNAVLERVDNNYNLRSFTQTEIEEITNGYCTVLGEGGFGKVYKGKLDDLHPVAVKRYKNGTKKEEFAKEVIVHSQINHKNVVRLLGCCTEENALMIVMEFVSNGNLYNVLHCDTANGPVPFPLDKRLDIAIESAEVLSCMHSMYSPVLHGDIKPGNILLDENFRPKISDFGIARLLAAEENQYTRSVIGCIGYMDPLFCQSGILTPKSDVYSFGVVLLEIITRKKAADGNIILAQSFAEALRKGKKVRQMFDEEIANDKKNMKLLDDIAKLAADCLKMEGKMRPQMVEVADRLRTVRKAFHQRKGRNFTGSNAGLARIGMTEEDFIKNNRNINGGNDLPREMLSELYHAICRNEIKTTPEQGIGHMEISPSRWINLMRKFKSTHPYIVGDSQPFLDHDIFAIMSGPTIAAIAVVFDHSEHEEVLLTCVDGFLGIAKILAFHHLEDVLDDLVVSLCEFTTLLDTSLVVEPVTAFGDDLKARLATETLFTIANRYGDYIRTGWRNALDCILRLHKLGLLPARVSSDAADDSEVSKTVQGNPPHSSISTSHIAVMGTPPKSSGLMGRFIQLLSLDSEEPRSQLIEQQLAARQRTLQTIQKCCIDSIFTDSKFLKPDSLVELARALIWAGGRPQKVASSDDEDTAVFCFELLIAITLSNLDRIVLLWQGLYEHIGNIVQSKVMPCPLVEKAIFGLLGICQRLIPYKDNLADDLLRSLMLVLKLDAHVADAYIEKITQEIACLLKANAGHIKSKMGWKTVVLLLSITARHPDASGVGFEAIMFIMSEGHLSESNYAYCIEASRQFAESRVGLTERSIRALDLIADSVSNLSRWSEDIKGSGEEADKGLELIRAMWLKLLQALKKSSLDPREEVRNHALISLQRCLTETEGICLQSSTWSQAFDLVIFALLDDLLEIGQSHSQKDYRNMEGSLVLAMKLVAKVYLQLLPDLFGLSSFCKLWLGVLSRMEKYMKIKVRGMRTDKLQELIPELLRSILVTMKTRGILARRSTTEGDALWELTWLHVNNISTSLQSEIFPSQELEQPNNVGSPRGLNNGEAQN